MRADRDSMTWRVNCTEMVRKFHHPNNECAIELEDISKTFLHEGRTVESLRNVSLRIASGETVAIIGRSGSGKSTLINVMCALVAPTSGTFRFFGKEVAFRFTNSLAAARLRQRCGYVSQSSDMMNNLSVIENVKLAAESRRIDIDDDEARRWLAAVGLERHTAKYPVHLSGGERQRANIARALACRPDVLFADEPTGSLDVSTSRSIIDLMRTLSDRNRSTFILVTHSPEYASRCNRQICLRDGRIKADRTRMQMDEIFQFIEESPGEHPSRP